MMAAVASGVLLGIPLMMRLGRRLGQGQGKGESAGGAAMSGAIFALVGLLIAFTFSGAAARYDERRMLVVDEANAIGTAWLRLDLLPAEAQPRLRDLFRRYLDLRISVYAQLPDVGRAFAELHKADALQREIWQAAVAAIVPARNLPAETQLLPALNEMIDLTTTRTVIAQIHPPPIIYWLLGLLLMLSGLLIGYEQARKPSIARVHVLVYSVVMAVAVFVTLNLEYPRLGFIGMDAADQVLVGLRESMN
jgi:hypothetical protein